MNLKALLDEIYDQSGYGLVINYAEDPVPPLSDSDRIWLENYLE